MAEKIIILKNSTGSEIILSDIGIYLEANDSVTVNYEDILDLADDQELIGLVEDGTIIVNNGSSDLSIADAKLYLSVEPDLSPYELKGHTHIREEVIDFDHSHPDLYYGKGEVDSLISGVEGYGIVGAADTIDDLPSSYPGNVGDIYVVRMTTGQGTTGPQPYTVTTETGLYLPMEDNDDDALGHSGTDYSSTNPTDTPLTPPFGTKYCDFDGNNDWLKFHSNSDFGQGPTLTVGCWIYTRQSGTYGIISRWDDYGDGWKLDVYGGKLRASLDTLDMNPVQFLDSNSLTQNIWTHVAMVYDGSNCILYRNATEVNRVSANGSYIDSQDKDIYIAKYMGNYYDGYFDGGMKDIFVQNSAMSQEQLQELVDGGIESFADEGFYQWDGSDWQFLARNTGENGGGSGSSYHNSLLGLNTGDYQHLTQQEKLDLIDHNHDDRYYTENEVDSLLSNKSDDNHTHSQYQTSSQVDSKIQALKYSDISANDPNTNVTGSELETLTNGGNADGLHTHESLSGGGSGGLDEAYDNNSQYSPGVGRQINVDTGSVTLNASAGFAPLKLTPINYTPTQWLGGGEICYYDGDLFAYDAVRGKWLSVSGHYIGGGVNSNNVKNSYLKGFNGTSFSSNVGWAAHWDGTVVSFSITSDDSGCSNAVQIRKNGSSIYELYYSQDKEQHRTNVNVDFNAGDVLNFYMEGNDNNADRPQVWAIIKRRI